MINDDGDDDSDGEVRRRNVKRYGLHGSLPAWVGSGGVGGLILLQVLGVDISQATGLGVGGQIRSIELRLDEHDRRIARVLTEGSVKGARLGSLEGDVRILNERQDNGIRDRAELKATMNELAKSMNRLAQSMVRMETKLDLPAGQKR